MMTITEAEQAIYSRVGQFNGVPSQYLRIENQPTPNGKPFIPPANAPWCSVFIQYADSELASIGNAPCVRDHGIISVQCFTPLNGGTLAMANLCQLWRELLQSFMVSHLEVYKVHAPEPMQSKDFYAKIVRANFRVN